jgi:protein arginine kinase activator
MCHKAEAVLHVKHAVDGVIQDMFICSACADAVKTDSGQELVDMIINGFDSVFDNDSKPGASPRRCPECGMSTVDYEKQHRMGCAMCYEIFADELQPALDEMHGALKHIGKCPSREVARSEIEKLMRLLQTAVNNQNFEQAAELRDKIRELENM